MTNEVRDVYNALIGPSRVHYEEVRERLIDRLGYDAFFDIQHEAFLVIASGQRGAA